LSSIIVQYLTININKLKLDKYLDNYFRITNDIWQNNVLAHIVKFDSHYFEEDYYWNNNKYEWQDKSLKS
jgi:hypothetical protein